MYLLVQELHCIYTDKSNIQRSCYVCICLYRRDCFKCRDKGRRASGTRTVFRMCRDNRCMHLSAMANTFALICSNTLAHILSRQTPSLVSVQTPSLLSFQMFVYFFVAHLRREMAGPCQQLRSRSNEDCFAWHEQEEPWACP